jgi:hypothetical protein
MTLLRMRLNPYRAFVHQQEKERAAAAAAEAARVGAEADRARALEEMGEIRLIGRKHYIVKDGEVFEIAPPRDRRGGILHVTTPRDIMRAVTTTDPRFQVAVIRALRGPRAFASTNEAEEHWAAIEEAEIVGEARRRLAEEQRVAAAADAAAAREARIRAAMENLRP